MDRTALRYALLQLPGLALAAAGLRFAVANDWISAAVGWAAIALWLAKDIAFYPLLRNAYRPDPSGPGEAYVGRTVVAEDELNPEGRVSLGGESWRARKSAASAPIAGGEDARVVDIEGLCLVVESVSDNSEAGVALSDGDAEIASPSSGRKA